jgi:hypothetical protein
MQRASQTLSPDAAHGFAQTLVDQGIVVVPIYETPAALGLARAHFEEALASFPEYRRDTGSPLRYVKGGFGALGTPSSFHNASVRAIRMDAMPCAISLFGALRSLEAVCLPDGARTETRGLEQLVDRMRVFTPGSKVMAESWHRDTTPAQYVQSGDSIFGGWINLDAAAPQYFSCMPKSHRLEPLVGDQPIDFKARRASGGEGFARFGKSDQSMLDELRASHAKSIEVPPGHMLVFYQEIVHEVIATTLARGAAPSYRLFTAWRLTDSTEPFALTQPSAFFTDFATPSLKSAQAPRLWPKGSWFGQAAAREGLATWSQETFRPELLVSRIVKSGECAGERRLIVPETLVSMRMVAALLNREWPLTDTPMYAPYAAEERSIYTPTTHWTLRGKHFHL